MEYPYTNLIEDQQRDGYVNQWHFDAEKDMKFFGEDQLVRTSTKLRNLLFQ